MIEGQFFGIRVNLQLKPVGQQGLQHRPDLILGGHGISRRRRSNLIDQSVGPSWSSRDLVFFDAVRVRNQGMQGASNADAVAFNVEWLARRPYERKVRCAGSYCLIE